MGVMSGPLKTTLTGSMESVSVQETCTKPPCDDARQTDERLQPTADTESAHDSDATHTCQPSRPDTDMDITDGAVESDSPSDIPKHKPCESVADSTAVDALGTDRKQTDDCVSPLSLKRKCVSVDESKLRQHFQEKEAERERQRREDEAAQAARQASARTTGPKYFVKDWMFLGTLGEGAYGEVKLAYNDKTEEAVAVKIINTKKASPMALSDIRKEICIHRMLNHKNVLRFWGMRKEKDTQYLFLQYAVGGELFDKIEPDVGMPQADAQRYYRQLIDGLEYLHQMGIAHRDLKPENLLLDERDNLKIADFGFATVFRHDGKWRYLDRLCGSPPYLAPEAINLKPYRAEPADIWSSGVVLVAMLGGELPWDSAVLSCTDYVNWRECHIENRPWNKIDNLALCLLRRLLAEKPEKRYTIEQVHKNPWFKKDFSAEAAQQLSMGPNRKRPRTESERSPGAVSCSQPTMSSRVKDSDSSMQGQAADPSPSEGPISFSQPAQTDNLLLSSQLNATQSSQTPMQKLVRRMTRFFCRVSRGEVVEELDQVFEQLDYSSWKLTTANTLTVHTVDRRQSPLVFKAMILEMGGSLLVDFRLSKGDGLEFKRQFLRIRELMKSSICRVPSSWPSLPSL